MGCLMESLVLVPDTGKSMNSAVSPFSSNAYERESSAGRADDDLNLQAVDATDRRGVTFLTMDLVEESILCLRS
eukprot:CAMPEP_0170320252 /NCGR_PEP_ID=MMETSP0116_2-20130129/60856_1 /TAXON_ID=400756 /ORGANISM="Durinskia baltica, Strain CSIRO CS-38" /LENGTH=73 /DNA_ID=CAMNT_0010573015 /DNA_START=273 /DNA_END=491 /DNA_ORIENTATION=-